jgi:hypothetical protein
MRELEPATRSTKVALSAYGIPFVIDESDTRIRDPHSGSGTVTLAAKMPQSRVPARET